MVTGRERTVDNRQESVLCSARDGNHTGGDSYRQPRVVPDSGMNRPGARSATFGAVSFGSHTM